MCFSWSDLSSGQKIFLVVCVVLSSILLITIIILALGWASTDYCASTACANGSHTMCLYPSSYPSAQCGEYISYPLTWADMDTIVDKHNEYRKKVADGLETRGSPGPQPPATNMQSLKWDSELAKIAQRYADQCADGHDGCRDVERFSVGQNIATTWGTEMEATAASLVKGWYEEVALFNKDLVKAYQFNSGTGHYSQVVWAKTSYVGCGRARYRAKGSIYIRLICNYGPSGNYAGDPVYLTP